MARGAHSAGRPPGASARPASSRAARRATGRRVRLPRIGRDPGDRLLAVGIGLFFVGLLAIALTFIPFVVLGRSNSDLAINLGSFATVLGLALGALGAYRQGRSPGR